MCSDPRLILDDDFYDSRSVTLSPEGQLNALEVCEAREVG